ncbi:MAG: cation-translocating P-type ATPase [Anaerolineae bacterium]|nr:cation-translocating P-type ATPase [Anaerolineae bacterium]
MPSVQGLSEQEVTQRRQQGQGNDVDFSTSRSYLQIIRYNVLTFVNMVLFAIGFALLVLGLPQDAITTAGLAILNALVGIVQEARAKYQLDKITLLTRPGVIVIRGGQEKTVGQQEIVLGDMILIQAGDQLICDGLIVEANRIEMDESLLTGESDTIPKQAGDKVFSGSFCVSGSGIYEATEVGKASLANKITAKARSFKLTRTPLQSDVNKVVRWVGLISVIMGAGLWLNALDESLEERVQMMAVVIGMIPQGLIFLVTLAYGLGAVRIAGKGALVQRINAIESMSNVTILCLDKTGTLTTNRINFHSLYPYQIEEARLKTLLGHFAASGSSSNRTSEAILAACQAEKITIVEEVPFTSARKWSGLSFSHDGITGTYILGAPEILQPALATYPQDFDTQMEQWSHKGLRVVMFAHVPQIQPLHNGGEKPVLPANLVPLGLISLSDELRPDADETLKNFSQAGIRLKIISGDNPNTVASLARQAGFDTGSGVISGLELEKMDAETFARTAHEVSVFGRITPDQKENLVKVLKEQGYYVAMIGDGVNDVLSLKQAHIGISMQSGSTATRNAADIVLLNDSFAALPGVFVEGQKILNGMQDTMRLLLSRTFFVVLIVTAVTLTGKAFPFLPRHDALISFINAGLPPIFLAAWARPGTPERNLLGKAARFVVPAAFMLASVGFGVYFCALEAGSDLETARTALVTVTIFCGMFLILFVKPPVQFFAVTDTLSADNRPVWLVVFLVIAYFALMLVNGLNDFFELKPLEITTYAALAAISAAWMLILRFILQRVERLTGKAAPESLQ